MNCWLQITSGRGPIECAWVVPRLLRCLLEECARVGLKAGVLETISGPAQGTLASALLSVEGKNLQGILDHWTGTILWIGPSPFRPHHKRKNWYVGVEALCMPEQFHWSEKELRFESMRSSGPGGQHVNKTESAIRVTHTPTGLTVTAREERSQTANKKLALARLSGLLKEWAQAGERQAQQRRWAQHNAMERGNPVRIYEGTQFLQRSVKNA